MTFEGETLRIPYLGLAYNPNEQFRNYSTPKYMTIGTNFATL